MPLHLLVLYKVKSTPVEVTIQNALYFGAIKFEQTKPQSTKRNDARRQKLSAILIGEVRLTEDARFHNFHMALKCKDPLVSH